MGDAHRDAGLSTEARPASQAAGSPVAEEAGTTAARSGQGLAASSAAAAGAAAGDATVITPRRARPSALGPEPSCLPLSPQQPFAARYRAKRASLSAGFDVLGLVRHACWGRRAACAGILRGLRALHVQLAHAAYMLRRPSHALWRTFPRPAPCCALWPLRHPLAGHRGDVGVPPQQLGAHPACWHRLSAHPGRLCSRQPTGLPGRGAGAGCLRAMPGSDSSHHAAAPVWHGQRRRWLAAHLVRRALALVLRCHTVPAAQSVLETTAFALPALTLSATASSAMCRHLLDGPPAPTAAASSGWLAVASRCIGHAVLLLFTSGAVPILHATLCRPMRLW